MAPENNTDNLVALVTGANGVTGDYVVAQLASESYWTRIIATSRRRPYHLPNDPRVEFAQADLSTSEDEVVKQLYAIKATDITHFFHLAYIHDDSFELQYEYNVPFFRNVLAAVDQLNYRTLQRVVLQTGAKHYGFHFKPPQREPIAEEMGRLGQDGPPNFYYPQEDFMFALRENHHRPRKWTWNVTRPFLISGFTSGSGQSFVCTAALYFTMQKYLGEEAVFSIPSDGESCYDKRQDISSAANIAAFTSHLARHPDAANQAYNVVDNDPAANGITFRDIWESMGSHFGIPVTTKEGFDIEADISAKLKRGVWRKLVEKRGGDPEACEKFATWSFFGWVMRYAKWGAHVSMEKAARETGWKTRFDSREEMRRIFQRMVKEGVIPDLRSDEA